MGDLNYCWLLKGSVYQRGLKLIRNLMSKILSEEWDQVLQTTTRHQKGETSKHHKEWLEESLKVEDPKKLWSRVKEVAVLDKKGERENIVLETEDEGVLSCVWAGTRP